MRLPRAIVIAGPAGAGKSSSAPAVLRDFAGVTTYINAGVIAEGLPAFNPNAAAPEAGRVMLRRIEGLIERGDDSAFESTLAGLTARQLLKRAQSAGHETHLFYCWLPSPELAIARVQMRLRAGGHDVPESTIWRRFARSLRNFWHVYRPLVAEWRLYGASDLDAQSLVATAVSGALTVHDTNVWDVVERAVATSEEGTQ